MEAHTNEETMTQGQTTEFFRGTTALFLDKAQRGFDAAACPSHNRSVRKPATLPERGEQRLWLEPPRESRWEAVVFSLVAIISVSATGAAFTGVLTNLNFDLFNQWVTQIIR